MPLDDVEESEIDRYVDLFELLLRNAKFSDVNEALGTLAPDAMAPASVLAVLTLTWYARDQLTFRPAFVILADLSLRRRLGDERALALLKNRR